MSEIGLRMNRCFKVRRWSGCLDDPVPIQRFGHHGESAVVARPFVCGTIYVQLDSVAVVVCKIQCLADPVIRTAMKTKTVIQQSQQDPSEFGPRRNANREVVQTRGALDALTSMGIFTKDHLCGTGGRS